MARTLKIGGDISQLKRDIMGLSKDFERLGGRRKVQIFDKETREFLERNASQAIASMEGKMEDLDKAQKKVNERIKSGRLTREQTNKMEREALRISKERISLEKDLNDVIKARENLTGQQAGAGRRFAQGAAGGAQESGGGGLGALMYGLPGIGRLMRGGGGAGRAGLGMAGMAGGVLGGGLLAAGGMAVSRGMAGVNAFSQGTGQMIDLMGRGLGGRQATGRIEEAQNLGFDPEDVRSAQMQAVDIFGREGATMEAVSGRMRTARGLGVDIQQLQQAGAGMREQLGVSGAQKTFAKLEANLIATEMEGAIGPYLETAANMLTNINEHGMGLDQAALQSLSTLTEVEGISPERAAKTMQNIDEAMKGATGERAAFFMSSLASRGVGGGRLGGAQVGMQMGLFGGDLSKIKDRGLLKEQDVEALENMKIAVDPEAKKGAGLEAFRERVGAITDTFDRITQGMDTTGKMLTAQKITGMENPVAALESIEMARKAAKVEDPEKRKEMMEEIQDKMKTPQEKMVSRLDQIVESNAGLLKVSQAFKQANLEALGEQLAPAAAKGNELLSNIDRMLSATMEFFGVETVQQEQERKATTGELDLEKYGDLPKERRAELRQEVQKEVTNLREKAERLQTQDERTGGGRYGVSNEKEVGELRQRAQMLEKFLQDMYQVNLQQLQEQKKTNKKTGPKGRGSSRPNK